MSATFVIHSYTSGEGGAADASAHKNAVKSIFIFQGSWKFSLGFFFFCKYVLLLSLILAYFILNEALL